MAATNSVSKGIFVFSNGAANVKRYRKPQPSNSFLDAATTSQLWFQSYRKHWDRVQSMIGKIQSNSCEKILVDLLGFIESCYYSEEYEGVLPTAALLTGINQIDHLSQFEKIADNIRNKTFSYVVLLQSRDGPNLKQAIETIVEGFTEEGPDSSSQAKPLRKNQLNLEVLKAWYLEKHSLLERKANLTIILPDFELFNPLVLQDIILILNAYATCLPFVLILGVATSITTVHNVLPYHVTSKIKLSIFQSEPSISNLNKILNDVLLTPYCPLHFSNHVSKLIFDIFLFYDFSVNGFVRGCKLAFMEHYTKRSINALCTPINDEAELHAMVNQLSALELEQIRELPSFRPFVESLQDPQQVVNYLTDDKYLKRALPALLMKVHNYWFTFHCALGILQTLVSDLPRAPLGKQLRELYCFSVENDVTQMAEFQECIQLLTFLSKEEMLLKINKALDFLLVYVGNNDQLSIEGCFVYDVAPIEEMARVLADLSEELAAASQEQIVTNLQQEQQNLLSPTMGRQELREKLLTAARHAKSESGVTRAIGRLMEYFVKDIFQRYLRPPNDRCIALIELFLFNDSSAVRRHLMGAQRAAVHTALTNPHHYLKCQCCVLDDETSILPTLPDISIAYKLHMECGRMINLFDWLQAFRTIVDGENVDDHERNVSPQIQARFTRAVAELQFLGFIKPSKQKTDHVIKLTW